MNKINGYDRVEWDFSLEEVEKIYGSLIVRNKDNNIISYIQHNPEKYIEERTFVFSNNKLQSVLLTISDRNNIGYYNSQIIFDVINKIINELGDFNEGEIIPNFGYKKISNTKFIKEKTGAIFSIKKYYKNISNNLKIEMCISYQDNFDNETYSNPEEIFDEKSFIPEVLLIEYINPEWEKVKNLKKSEIENKEREKRKAEINKITL